MQLASEGSKLFDETPPNRATRPPVVPDDDSPTTCPANLILDGGQCRCPEGTTWGGPDTGCVSRCQANLIFDQGDCVCPSGTSWDGAACVTTCAANSIWNGSQCVCPSGTSWDGSRCVTPNGGGGGGGGGSGNGCSATSGVDASVTNIRSANCSNGTYADVVLSNSWNAPVRVSVTVCWAIAFRDTWSRTLEPGETKEIGPPALSCDAGDSITGIRWRAVFLSSECSSPDSPDCR